MSVIYWERLRSYSVILWCYKSFTKRRINKKDRLIENRFKLLLNLSNFYMRIKGRIALNLIFKITVS